MKMLVTGTRTEQIEVEINEFEFQRLISNCSDFNQIAKPILDNLTKMLLNRYNKRASLLDQANSIEYDKEKDIFLYIQEPNWYTGFSRILGGVEPEYANQLQLAKSRLKDLEFIFNIFKNSA